MKRVHPALFFASAFTALGFALRRRMWKCGGKAGLVTALGLTVAALASSAYAQTFVQWTSASGGNDHYYALTLSATDWQAAENLAITQGGHLASITSATEQSFINATFLTGAFASLPLWIGLTDVPHGVGSMNYTNWTTGEPVSSYANWLSGEPNNNGSGEDYGTINWNTARLYPTVEPLGTWNDTPLNGTTGFGGNSTGPYYGLMESNVIPEPATYAVFIGLGALGFALLRRRRTKAA